MSLIRWLKSLLSRRGKALSFIEPEWRRRISATTSAIADYTAAIQVPDVPADVKAMATYNRALAYSSVHNDIKAAEDLATVLEMPGLSQTIKREAQERRERIRRRDEKRE